MSRDPDMLPGLRTLGDRLGDAAEREIAAEQAEAAPRRRRRWNRPFLLAGVVAAMLVGAAGVTATGVFTGSGDPVEDEPQPSGQAGVLTDSAAADPGGGLPWALRVFVDDRGRECLQLGRLRDGVLGMVQSGQFRPYAGDPNGTCGDLREDPIMNVVERRSLPAARTVVYGRTRARGPVEIRLGGGVRTIRPGALGAYVTVYPGIQDLSEGTVSVVAGGRRITHRLGR